MAKLQFTQTEMIEKENHRTKRYPNLSTVLMVEDFLKKHRDTPMKISEIKAKLPKQVMHQTLKIILEYLFRSGKIMYGPKGIQWIYSEPEHLKKMFEDTLEI
ncbi:MAG: hypothetical protein Q8N77_02410 [Nanoarchaeota archaeon]|nr:hypothetical protein [Nanoarchaeota archaeon]